MATPDPILEAAAQAAHDLGCSCNDAWHACRETHPAGQTVPALGDSHWEREGQSILAAVRSLIEVDYHHAQYADMLAAAQMQAEGEIESAVRQQIAMEIESAECEVADQSGGYVMACCARRRQDAAIARRGAQ